MTTKEKEAAGLKTEQGRSHIGWFGGRKGKKEIT